MSHAGQRQLMGASHGHVTQPDYYPITFASAAYELAASACPPQTLKRPQTVARVRSQEDRASILDRIIVSGAVVAALIGAGSLLVGIGYWFV